MYTPLRTLGENATVVERSAVALLNARDALDRAFYEFKRFGSRFRLRDLEEAAEAYADAVEDYEAAVTARETVDRGLPRIAEAVRKHRDEEHPSEEEIHP